MLIFKIYVTDSDALQFPVILQIPTRSGEADAGWGTQAGMLSFRGGPAWITASPATSRGTVMCIGIDVDGGRWPAVEMDQLFAQFARNEDGSYGIMSLNQSGSGQTFRDTVVAVRAGAIKWRVV
jgi:hypothetical protein